MKTLEENREHVLRMYNELSTEEKKHIDYIVEAQGMAEDIKRYNINFHGQKYYIDEFGTLWIETVFFLIWIQKRNAYCDRGRYDFMIESQVPELSNINYMDFFPRYFFSLQRGIDEINDFVNFRTAKIVQTYIIKAKNNDSTTTDNETGNGEGQNHTSSHSQ